MKTGHWALLAAIVCCLSGCNGRPTPLPLATVIDRADTFLLEGPEISLKRSDELYGDHFILGDSSFPIAKTYRGTTDHKALLETPFFSPRGQAPEIHGQCLCFPRYRIGMILYDRDLVVGKVVLDESHDTMRYQVSDTQVECMMAPGYRYNHRDRPVQDFRFSPGHRPDATVPRIIKGILENHGQTYAFGG